MARQKGCALASVFLVCAAICGTAAAAESVLFQDTFSGTSIDATQWTTRTLCAYSTGTCSSKAQATQSSGAFALSVAQDDYAWAQAVSTQSFDSTVSSVEWETWQDSTSSWQGWPLSVGTPIAGFGYYNYQWYWTAMWRNAQGIYTYEKKSAYTNFCIRAALQPQGADIRDNIAMAL